MPNILTSVKTTAVRTFARVFGTAHERTMKRLRPTIYAINGMESAMRRLSNDELRARTAEFRDRLDQGASLDDLLPEAFAVVREASLRTTGLRHYDVQLVGGIALHQGKIAEMKTGEGKTLVATLALYLNALEGKGAHLVTVNDYLARRDAEWMGQIYGFLGLSTGVIEHGQSRPEKKRAYRADITYGQNNEFGFDYLRDNMRFSIYDYVQRDLHYAIVDEADSILVDEARTPLIISGAAEESAALYTTVDAVIPRLRRDIDFTVDEEHKTVTLSEEGVDEVEKLLSVRNLYDSSNIEYLHHVHQALKAHYCYKKDVNYAVREGEIVIIDEFTGRLMPGRRWSDGLHQAIEAKEHVRVQEENRTLATISFQNLFRLYDKLSGMTGTADTEAQEFNKTYKLDVVVIPTNRPCVRTDYNDLIYRSYREKRTAVVEEILDCQSRGQPVLVGTVSVEKSEDLSRVLTRKGITHHVLNAKHHEREAYIVAQAGRAGAVTVATNMAGRGTDILLGGNPAMLARAEVEALGLEDPAAHAKAYEEALERFETNCAEERVSVIRAGGLHILGTERHESRRIDNQLRGRAGRQGDPGSSRFYLSLEDDLMRIFAGERVAMIMDKLGMPEGEPIEHRMVTRSVERAQTKVEQRNFDIRKNLLEYDDVMNQQRKAIYAMRRQILEGRYQAVAISDSEEVKKQVEQEARVIEIDPVLRDRVAASLRLWFLEHGRFDTEGDDADPNPTVDGLVSIKTEELEQRLYDQVGVRVPLEDYANQPAEAFELALTECARSLSEQRERLLDMVEEAIAKLIAEHAAPQQIAARDLDSLAEAARKTFDIWVEDLDRFQTADEIAESLFSEVEWIVKIRDTELSPAQIWVLIEDALFTHCPPRSDPSTWDLAALETSLEATFKVPDVGDLAAELKRLQAAAVEAAAEPAGASPYREPGQPNARALRHGLFEVIRQRVLEHWQRASHYLNTREESGSEVHPAQAVVTDLVKKYCVGDVPSPEWRLDELGREVEKITGAPPIRFELEVLLEDARRAIERNITLAAETREQEILDKIIHRCCPSKATERWDREKLAEEIMDHMGVHCSAIETAETHQELLDGIWRDLRETHRQRVIKPLLDRMEECCPTKVPFESWELKALGQELKEKKIVVKDLERVELQRFVVSRLLRSVERVIRARAHVLGPEAHLHAYRQLLLTEIDKQWIDHLQNMEALRQGIGIRSYGQRDPKREYQREGYGMFQEMIAGVQTNALEKLFHIVFRSEDDAARLGRRRKRETVESRGGDVQRGTVKRAAPKVGRNDPCPCGSGKKYKKCCMLKEQASA